MSTSTGPYPANLSSSSIPPTTLDRSILPILAGSNRNDISKTWTTMIKWEVLGGTGRGWCWRWGGREASNWSNTFLLSLVSILWCSGLFEKSAIIVWRYGQKILVRLDTKWKMEGCWYKSHKIRDSICLRDLWGLEQRRSDKLKEYIWLFIKWCGSLEHFLVPIWTHLEEQHRDTREIRTMSLYLARPSRRRRWKSIGWPLVTSLELLE